MDLSIIILNYKSKEKTFRCIESLKADDLSGLVHEIIVIDNNSERDLQEELLSKYPTVNFIQSDKNLGMGGGNNLGIKHAQGDYVLILNPDVYVRPGAVKKLYNYINNLEDVGLVAPKLLNPDGSIQYSCFRDYKFLTPLYRRTFLGRFKKKHLDNFLMKDFDRSEIRDVDWIMGSCLLAKRDVLLELNGFNEKFFMYFEDTDLCRRLRRKGYRVVFYPHAEAVHDHARDSAKQIWFLAPFKNRLAREHIKSWLKYFLKN